MFNIYLGLLALNLIVASSPSFNFRYPLHKEVLTGHIKNYYRDLSSYSANSVPFIYMVFEHLIPSYEELHRPFVLFRSQH
jgi:hypothetical protein